MKKMLIGLVMLIATASCVNSLEDAVATDDVVEPQVSAPEVEPSSSELTEVDAFDQVPPGETLICKGPGSICSSSSECCDGLCIKAEPIPIGICA